MFIKVPSTPLASKMEEVEVPQNIDLSKLKVDELKTIAKEKGVEGHSNMKKSELIESIEKLG